MENISDSTSDAIDGKAEKDFDENGNRIISLNFAPVNTNQQNFINVDSKIDFNTKVGDERNPKFGTVEFCYDIFGIKSMFGTTFKFDTIH